MKSIEFVYFKKNKYQLYSADTGEVCVMLRNYLDEMKVENCQYFADMLPNLYDIVDDILSEDSEVICFYIDNFNRSFSLSIAKALQESGEEVEIIFLSEAKMETEIGRVLNRENLLEEIADILEIEEKEENYKFTLKDAYKKSYIPLNQCSQYGVILNKHIKFNDCKYVAPAKDIIEEINYISKYASKDQTILLNTDNINEYDEIDKLLEGIKELSINQKIVLKIKEECLSILLEKLKDSGIVLKKAEDVFSNEAMENGITAFYLGYYPVNIDDEYSKHIQINKDEITEEVLRKLASHNSGNSGLYGVGNGTKSYDEVKDLAEKSGFLFTNYLSFNKTDNEKEYSIDINGVSNAGRMSVVSYSKYKSATGKNNYVNIETREDFETFISDIKAFNKTGVIIHDRMWKPLMTDRCRWSMHGACSLGKLLRFRVEDKKVYPCISCNKSIGDIDSLHFELQRKAYSHIDKEEVNRRCHECTKKMICSRCSMLPEFVSSEEYCNLIKSGLDIFKYEINMLAIKYLMEMGKIKLLSEHKVEDIIFATSENGIEIDKVAEGTKKYVEDDTIFLKVKGEKPLYIIFNMRSKKALKLNKNFFIICELLNKGLEAKHINEYLINKYNLEEAKSQELVSKVLSILNKEHFLKG